MKTVVLFTVHYFESKRQVGIHWIADAFWRAGWQVIFVTGFLSYLSYFRKDNRLLQYPVRAERNRLKWVRPRLGNYVRFPLFHPVSLRNPALNALTTPVFAQFGRQALGDLEDWVRQANVFIFENGPDLMLFDRIKQLNPSARYVYRVSDDLSQWGVHPVIKQAELAVAPHFDLISTPSESIHRRFAHLPNEALQPHGVAAPLFDAPCPSPYRSGETNVVFVGGTQVDTDFAEKATRLFPEWRFHFIGPIRGLTERPNAVIYGELPFRQTVPYLKHADIGLQMRSFEPGMESVTDSLKMMQYTYCGLPIVAPEFLRSDKPHVFYYQPGDQQSIREALLAARRFDRTLVPRHSVRTWDSVASALAGEPLLASPPSLLE